MNKFPPPVLLIPIADLYHWIATFELMEDYAQAQTLRWLCEQYGHDLDEVGVDERKADIMAAFGKIRTE